jgi:hypothetical protein
MKALAVLMAGFAVAATAEPYRLMEHSAQQWRGSTFWTAGGWARVGRDWQHPELNTASVRRFELPADGAITIAGRVAKADAGGGDGVAVEIRLDDTTVWSNQLAATDLKGVEVSLPLTVRRGQVLRFIVTAQGSIAYDSTQWDPVIRHAGGEPYQASKAFGDRQGQGGWWYESMPVTVAPGKAPPAPPAPAVAVLPDIKGLDLPALTELEWKREDVITDDPASYARAIERHLAGARALLANLRAGRDAPFLAAEAATLEQLAAAPRTDASYWALRRLKRRILFANPLLNFGPLLFVKRAPPNYSHLVMQYFGWRQRPGGGLFVLEEPGKSLKAREILPAEFARGNVLEPSLSFDGRRIVFSWVDLSAAAYDGNPEGADDKYFHLYTVNTDGTGLKQITSGPYDDLMPSWLPDGGIAFCSTRRKGYARCFGGAFGRRWHVYTLHRVEADGSRLTRLSEHDTNEWFPTPTADGNLLYARWDYIDRDAVTHQNLWLTRPDGSNPLALWGNATPNPHCAFQAKPVPGTAKIAFIASAHHSITAGSLVLLDPAVDPNAPQALTRLTPAVRFPESESRSIAEWYCSPWPLAEKYYLLSYSPLPLVWEPQPNPAAGLGLYVLDAFGNRELLYRDPDLGSTCPIPLAARPLPPVLPAQAQPNAPTGQMVLSDVYQGLGDVPRGTIKQLRIVQIFPKTTPNANQPAIGCAGEENARAILGTVPVEADGSACFEAPANKPILFHALTADGAAYQVMRTLTYVQPGERVACVGCHENRRHAASFARPLALRRSPSAIEPGPLGGVPFSYARFVQPVLDRHCIACHGKAKTEKGVDLTGAPGAKGFTRSYESLTRNAQLVPRYAARNGVQTTPPGGANSARGSGLLKLLRAGHHDVKLTDDDWRRLAAWLDLNAVFRGSCDPGDALAMPAIQ